MGLTVSTRGCLLLTVAIPVTGRVCGSTWTPANLFPTGTEEGLFLDFADISTLYTDQTFSTNISAIGDPVGGVLDKSQGGDFGPNEVTSESDIAAGAGWALSGTTVVANGSGNGAKARPTPSGAEPVGLYKLEFTATGGTVSLHGNSLGYVYNAAPAGTYSVVLMIPASEQLGFLNSPVSNAVSITITNFAELPGNHLIQATSTARPIWTRHPKSGVRNLVDASENLLSTWSLAGQSVVWDAIESAWSVTISGANITCPQQTLSLASATYTTTLEIKGTAGETINTRAGANPEVLHTFTGGWDTVTFTRTAAYDRVNLSTWGGATARQFYFRHAQVEEAATATPYQTRVSQYDVTEAGVDDCYGLTFDGVDDYMVTAANLDLSGTDEVTLTSGVSNAIATSGTNIGRILELGTTDGTDKFSLAAPAWNPYSSFDGRAGSQINDPILNSTAARNSVLTGLSGPDGGSQYLRKDGTQIGSGAIAATDPFISAMCYMGSRAGASQWFTGTIYGITLTDYILDAEQLAALEEWTAARTPEVTLA